ncbi:hypothetical protein D3C71_1479030 [compost metagenome]
MALVQLPGFLHRNPEQVQFLQNVIQRLDRPLQNRSERKIEGIARLLKRSPRFLRLLDPLLCQIRITPAGEQILLVIFALSMTDQHDFVHTPTPLPCASFSITLSSSYLKQTMGFINRRERLRAKFLSPILLLLPYLTFCQKRKPNGASTVRRFIFSVLYAQVPQ